ncbi:ABC-type transport auxiliary lipoprotein family protein [Paraglaciecola sp. 20A4]|uniref:PqiC family protein n=1 Tax=Paraglaciecola sp. 20A4 TaxID=2687288 RepID=UPI00140A5549|nr:ABC-type transport auxiliary lipoprotein family protein [Paraglaciecola sp. 20A4]
MKQFSVFLIILMLCGCSTSPEPRQQIYLLNSNAPLSSSADEDVKRIIVVDKIQLADYLERPNLVMQIDGNQLYYSDIDLWAESLQTDIHKTLLAWLNDYAKDTQFVAYDSPQASAKFEHLIVSIEHFMPTDKGSVVSDGQYWLVGNKQLESLSSQHTFAFTSALTQKGYSHSVTHMAKQIAQLSAQIVEDVE